MGRLTLALETSILIDLIRGHSSIVRDGYRTAAADGEDFAISALVMHELVSGIVTSVNPEIERERMQETLVGLPIIELTAEDVEITALIAGRLRRAGRPIGDIDTLIAGQALARGWSLVTRNIRHFGRVEGLPLIDWSLGPNLLTPDQIAARVAADTP